MSKWLKEWMGTYILAMKYEVLSIISDSEKYAIRDFVLALQNNFSSFYIRCWSYVEFGWLTRFSDIIDKFQKFLSEKGTGLVHLTWNDILRGDYDSRKA